MKRILGLLIAVWLSQDPAIAQTTAFSYQGKLTEAGVPAEGNYDLRFRLFDAATLGTQQGSSLVVAGVPVTDGVFTVQLDFGAGVFPGADRYLEIAVRPAGAGAYTTLGPRQPVTSAPCAIKSVNTGSFIRNQTTLQANSNFNIGGNGTAGGKLSGNVVNAATGYELNGVSILSNPGTNNLLAGVLAGAANTGQYNAFFGDRAGEHNAGGQANTFAGAFAGQENTSGINNTFVGAQAGGFNTDGDHNSFFGSVSGTGNLTGSLLTLIGNLADVGNTNLTNATAVGALALVSQDNSLVLGSIAGVNFADTTVNVGIGTTAPQVRLHVVGDTLVETGGSGGNMQLGTPNGETGLSIIKAATGRADARFDGSTLKLVAATGTGPPASTNGIAVTTAGTVGIGTTTAPAKLTVKGPGAINPLRVENSAGLSGLVVNDDRIVSIGVVSSVEAASTHLCVDSVNRLSFCTSSLRYKEGVRPYRGGLDLLARLRPILFAWKGTGATDVGLAAEQVAEVEPLLVTHNEQGEIQGVKYDQLAVVLINAVNAQQTQIERQQRQIDELKFLLSAAREQP